MTWMVFIAGPLVSGVVQRESQARCTRLSVPYPGTLESCREARVILARGTDTSGLIKLVVESGRSREVRRDP